MLKKHSFLLMLLIIVAFNSCTNKKSSELTDITIAQWGQEKYLIYLPLYVAMEEGYFQKNGININLLYTGNDDQTFATVISGDAQFGVGDPIFTAIAQERGFNAKVISTIVGGVSIWGVTNNKDMDIITKPEDLAGLRIGTFPEPSTNYTLMKETIENNKDFLGETKIIQAPIGSQIALLEIGDADIAMELEPGASIAESNGYKVVYSSPKFNGPYCFTGLSVTQELIDKDPQLIQNVVNALEEAVFKCHNDPTIAIKVGKLIFPNLSDEVIKNAVYRMIGDKTFPEHVLVEEVAWQATIKSRLTVGDLKNPQSTKVSVDNTFAINAMNRD